MATTDLVTTAQTEPLSIYIRRPDVVEKFSLVLGSDREALTFVQSVLLLVQNSEPGDEYSLMNCSKQSIVREALRAATLRVSVDPALRQAWLIPRKNKGNIEAHLQLHYAEVRNRAMRTGRYWFINVGPVYQGETVFENIYNGLHQVKLANGLMTSPTEQDGFVAVGERAGEVKGWLGYSKTTKGQQQTVYMSKEDIAAFMDKGPTGSYWAKSKAWKNNREIMERKTVLLALLRKSDLSAPGMDEVKKVVELVDSVETVDAGPDLEKLDELETVEGETTEPEPISAEEEAYIKACEVTTPSGIRLGDKEMTPERLDAVAKSKAHPDTAAAAQIIINWRKAKEQKALAKLGFS